MSSNRLAGKTAIVTGASKGIGAAIAKRFAAEGASVVVNYSSSRAAADALVADIQKSGGKALAVQADMANASQAAGLIEAAAKAFGQIDILVNNAGIFEFLPLEAVTEDHFHRQMNLNVLGVILAAQHALKHFNPAGGSIINISSEVSTYTPPNSVVYSATKGAVDAVTGVLAKELGAKKIRVNAIRPGMIETEGAVAGGFIHSDFRKRIESETPLGRIGQPQDIAGIAVFLASDDSGWVTGETILASGGHR